MRRLGIALALGLAAGSALAQSKEPIALRDMGSFHGLGENWRHYRRMRRYFGHHAAT